MPLSVFISYSHRDEALFEQLTKHLKPLEREGIIRPWHDRKIIAGSEFDSEISSELEKAEIILLLISPDFVASEYCWGIEMKRAIERHQEGNARVVPVILRPVDWQKCPFGRLVAVPKDGMPVTLWKDEDQALVDVAKALRRAAEEVSRLVIVTEHPQPRFANGAPSEDLTGSDAEIGVTFKYPVGRAVLTRMRLKIFADGAVIGSIGLNETAAFKVVAGIHAVHLSYMWRKSNTVMVNLVRGETARFECGFTGIRYDRNEIDWGRFVRNSLFLEYGIYLRHIT